MDILTLIIGFLLARLFGYKKIKNLEKREASALVHLRMKQRDYEELVKKWNDLAEQWNTLTTKLNSGAFPGISADSQFTHDELKTLLRLCHPDKHGGKKSANDITVKILSMVSR